MLIATEVMETSPSELAKGQPFFLFSLPHLLIRPRIFSSVTVTLDARDDERANELIKDFFFFLSLPPLPAPVRRNHSPRISYVQPATVTTRR